MSRTTFGNMPLRILRATLVGVLLCLATYFALDAAGIAGRQAAITDEGIALPADFAAEDSPKIESKRTALREAGGPQEVPPTAENLEKWLEDKELVVIKFGGPRTDLSKLRDSLTIKGDADLRLTPFEGGGLGGGVIVAMRVTPEAVRQTLALQAELAPRGYVLAGNEVQVWSYRSDPAAREQAHQLVPIALTALETSIKEKLPGIECTIKPSRRGELYLQFEYALRDMKGTVVVNSLTPDLVNVGGNGHAVSPLRSLHLPHSSMVVAHYSLPYGRPSNYKNSPERQTIRKALETAFEPLLTLEPSAPVWRDDHPPQPVMPAARAKAE